VKRPRGRWAKWYASVLTDKRAYPDAEFRAFASLVARAADVGPVWKNRQEVVDFLGHVVDGSTGEELVAFLIAKDDLHVRRGGRIELVGFAELHRQPADTTAADRQRRHRAKLRQEAEPVTAVRGDTPPIVPTSDRGRHGVTSTSLSSGTSLDERPTYVPDPGAPAPEDAAISWLAGHDALVMPNGNGYHRRLMDDAERHGPEKLVAALERTWAAGGRTARQLVLGASDMLNPIPSGKAIAKEEEAAEARLRSQRAVERTRQAARERAEWLADDDAPAQDSPRRVGALLHRPQSAGH
jgi:hypothetical protein